MTTTLSVRLVLAVIATGGCMQSCFAQSETFLERWKGATPMKLLGPDTPKDSLLTPEVLPLNIPVPYSNVGRLYFHSTTTGGVITKHWCTAQFVAPNVVLTAAHCIVDEDGTSKHDQFQLLTEDKRQFSFNNCQRVNPDWHPPFQADDILYSVRSDYGFLQSATPTTGTTYTVGSTSAAVPPKSSKDVEIFGYRIKFNTDGTPVKDADGNYVPNEMVSMDPGKPSKDGDILFQHVYSVPAATAGSSESLRGTSGGAWIEDPSPNRVVSITSAAWSPAFGGKPRIYGPYLEGAKAMINFVASGCN